MEPHSSNTVLQWNIVLGIVGIVVGAALLCAVQVANYRTSRDNPIYLVRICDQELWATPILSLRYQIRNQLFTGSANPIRPNLLPFTECDIAVSSFETKYCHGFEHSFHLVAYSILLVFIQQWIVGQDSNFLFMTRVLMS